MSMCKCTAVYKFPNVTKSCWLLLVKFATANSELLVMRARVMSYSLIVSRVAATAPFLCEGQWRSCWTMRWRTRTGRSCMRLRRAGPGRAGPGLTVRAARSVMRRCWACRPWRRRLQSDAIEQLRRSVGGRNQRRRLTFTLFADTTTTNFAFSFIVITWQR